MRKLYGVLRFTGITGIEQPAHKAPVFAGLVYQVWRGLPYGGLCLTQQEAAQGPVDILFKETRRQQGIIRKMFYSHKQGFCVSRAALAERKKAQDSTYCSEALGWPGRNKWAHAQRRELFTYHLASMKFPRFQNKIQSELLQISFLKNRKYNKSGYHSNKLKPR